MRPVGAAGGLGFVFPVGNVNIFNPGPGFRVGEACTNKGIPPTFVKGAFRAGRGEVSAISRPRFRAVGLTKKGVKLLGYTIIRWLFCDFPDTRPDMAG